MSDPDPYAGYVVPKDLTPHLDAPGQGKAFAKLVQRARRRLGLKVRESAKLIGVSPRTIEAWECGRSEPRVSQLRAIVVAYQCSVNELLDL